MSTVKDPLMSLILTAADEVQEVYKKSLRRDRDGASFLWCHRAFHDQCFSSFMLPSVASSL